MLILTSLKICSGNKHCAFGKMIKKDFVDARSATGFLRVLDSCMAEPYTHFLSDRNLSLHIYTLPKTSLKGNAFVSFLQLSNQETS